MEENNEIEVNVIDVTGVNESAVMSRLEVHSTPNVVLNSKLNESDTTDDLGIQLTPTLLSQNKKFDDDMLKRLYSMVCSSSEKQETILVN